MVREQTAQKLASIFFVGQALATNATEAMKESRIPDFLALVLILLLSFVLVCLLYGFNKRFGVGNYEQLNGLQYKGMDFEEFCAASISVHQHESLDCWEQSVRHAYELFEMNGNRVIVIEELASVSFVFFHLKTFYFHILLY